MKHKSTPVSPKRSLCNPFDPSKYEKYAKLLEYSPPIDPSQLEPKSLPPRCLKYSSRPEDNDLEYIRKRLRVNKFWHNLFDPTLSNTEGARYFD